MTFASSAKKRKVRCAALPHLHYPNCRTVSRIPPNLPHTYADTHACKPRACDYGCGMLMAEHHCLARTISQTVCAVRARRLISMARMPKSKTWIVAPLAYQNGPDTPYCHATLED